MQKRNNISKFKPAVSKNWLILVAGIMWSSVGILLGSYAVSWLDRSPTIGSLLLGLLGLIIAWLVYRYGFSKIAQKNINRILLYAEKVCIFAFQSWSGYLIIAVMMTSGILLKRSPISKTYLAVLYTAIGGGLFLSSFLYYTQFHRISRQNASIVEPKASTKVNGKFDRSNEDL